MSGQTQKQRAAGEREDTETEAPQAKPSEAAQKASEIIDDLIDEIDAVLEENAQEFVAAYVQKGGQ